MTPYIRTQAGDILLHFYIKNIDRFRKFSIRLGCLYLQTQFSRGSFRRSSRDFQPKAGREKNVQGTSRPASLDPLTRDSPSTGVFLPVGHGRKRGGIG